VPIEFRQYEGVFVAGGAGNITNFNVDIIVAGYAPAAGVAVGDILVVAGSTSNDGPYTVTQVVVAGAQFRVVPQPNAEAAAGTIRKQTVAGSKGGSDAITAFVATNIIQAATATFQTDGVQINDRVIVSGSGGTQSAGGNDGAWYVVSVDSQTQLTVQPLNGESNVVPGAGAGNVTVREGAVEIEFISIAGNTGFSAAASTGVPDTQVAPGTSDFAAGAITDYLVNEPAFTGPRTFWSLWGVRLITSSGSAFNFQSFDEIVISRNRLSNCIMQFLLNAQIYLGTDGGYDRYEAEEGSVWINVSFLGGTNYDIIFRGSYYDAGAAPLVLPGNDYEIASTIVRNGLTVGFGLTNSLIETGILYGAFLNLQLSGPSDFKNLSMCHPIGTAYIAALGGTLADVVIEGLLKGSYPNKPWLLFGVTLWILNPRADYSLLNDLISGLQYSGLAGAYAQAYKTYTWNPRFVERDQSGAAGTTPIQGLTVTLYQKNQYQPEVGVGSWTTAASGRLEGIESDRDGKNLVRQWLLYYGGLIEADFYQRVEVEGRDVNTGQVYRPVNEIFTMRAGLDFDFPMDVIRTDYEGEFNV
jgi:hypothetical protein